MNIIITTFIFAIVLFIYLHIFYHIKTSNDLEVYEVQNLSKERLEEVCNLRQPLTFYLDINCCFSSITDPNFLILMLYELIDSLRQSTENSGHIFSLKYNSE